MRRLALTAALAAIACGDGSGQRFDLGGGSAVEVSSTGGVALVAGGRVVASIPAEGIDVWSGERFEGRQTLTVDAPIGRPPVFSRNADRSDLRSIE